ncbi:uroporphyrinogen-III synthase [Poseidonocella sp. HB161398]|uniref:uroporphyrinogen-III synthase n=1 Tax=Poseidonocella sp. HB161398 TaxID=2320855 RepID=UPI001485FEA5|nr:uroporphyrinogen-III synthase [Poseidonocella sp. HB161398]
MPHAPLLLTRPAPESRRFAAEAQARLGEGPVVISPVMQIVPRAELPSLEGVAGVVLTSAQAVQPGICWPPGLPAWCVGGRTAAAAAAAGLAARSAEGALPELMALLLRERPGGRLLHLRGAHVSAPLAAPLSAAGLDIGEAVVYDQAPAPPCADALRLLAQPGPVLLPVFSARSARLLAPLLSGAAADLFVAAISPAAAGALPVQSAARLDVAARPDSGAVLDLLAKQDASLRA